MKTIETKIAKNGVKMYFLDGKRISRDKAIEISENADNEMLINALGANIEFKDAQAILVISTEDPLESGKDREFGWCFTNVVDAVEAAKKVAAPFGDRFIKAYIMGDAEHFDNKIVATVDKAGNVEVKKQTPTYIFTAYQIITDINGNERTDTFATYCKEIGDDDNFTGLYREVTFFDENRLSGWSIKTADGTIIAKGNTEAELKKAYENIKAGNVEVSEEIAEINAADVKVNVADNGKVIEQIKVDVDTAIKIINRLNYRNDTFVYSNTTRYDNADIKCRHFDAYKADGEKDAFAITEYVINGKLEIVRFFNLFRDITVDMKIGNVNYTIGDKGAIVLTDAEEIVDITDAETAEVIPVERFWCEVEIAGLSEQDAADIVAHFHGQDGANKFFKMRATELDGSEEDIDGDNVFDYLPALDELNDVDIDDDDNTPPDNVPMSDDISDICKYNPDLEDDDKSCRLDWDDSATFIDERTGEEELAAFINPQIVIEQGYLEPADKIAATKPKHSRRQLRDLIDSNLAEINYYLDGLDECSADENCPQQHIDFLHEKIKNLGKKYRQYYREYREAPAEEIAG